MERFNMNAFNPAFVGTEGREVAFTSRSTWIGVADAPRVNYFFYSGGQKKLSLDCNQRIHSDIKKETFILNKQ